MNGVTQEQRDAILTKAEALAGEPLGEAGALLAEIACERAGALQSVGHCGGDGAGGRGGAGRTGLT